MKGLRRGSPCLGDKGLVESAQQVPTPREDAPTPRPMPCPEDTLALSSHTCTTLLHTCMHTCLHLWTGAAP